MIKKNIPGLRKKINPLDTRELIKERKILIADKDPVHRAFLLSLVGELGFDTRKIFLAKDGTEALQLVQSEGITTVLYDDSLGMRPLEMIQITLAPEPMETVFVYLLSSNSSQAGVGQAVEADVDGFSLKPFAGEEFLLEFITSFSEKVQPDEFHKIINLGKTRLFSGEIEVAEKLFEKAKSLGLGPSSAHFYAGQVKLMKRLLEESRQEFMQGILLNQIHCKCLKAMFELLKSQSRTEESYEVLRRLVGIFPENRERLQLAIRMAVSTENYFDISTWYEVYEGQTEKNQELKKHVASALSVFGRYLLKAEKHAEALKAFERAIRVSEQKEVFLTYAVESLQKYGRECEAAELIQGCEMDTDEQTAA